MKLKKYLIYKNENSQTFEILQDGFSYQAGLFGGFWLAYHRIWSLAFIFSLYFILFQFMSAVNLSSSLIFNSLLQFLGFGFFAIDILEWHYKKQGYNFEDIIFAYSTEEAELKFYERLRDVQ